MTCDCGVLSIIGAITVAVIAVKILLFVKTNYLGGGVNIKKKYGTKGGSWAVVTGASDGIGRAMAIDLARRGMNVCVIARTKSKLEEVAEEIKELKAEAKIITFDFSDTTPHAWKKLFHELDALEIGVLVNNVGINYEFPQDYDSVSIDDDLRILRVNCESQLQMTKYVVPRMKAKRCGAILNMGSFSGVTPTAMLATYAATKSFSAHFSNCMAVELKPHGIDVLTVRPNLVITPMTIGGGNKTPKASFMRVAVKPFVRQTLDKLGSVMMNAGHSNHAIIEAVVTSFPVSFINAQILKMHKSINKRALSKKERQAAAGNK